MKALGFGLLLATSLSVTACAQAVTPDPRRIFADHRPEFIKLVQDIEGCKGVIAFYAEYRESSRCHGDDHGRSREISGRLSALGVHWAIAARTNEPGADVNRINFVTASQGLMIGPGSASMIVYHGDKATPLPDEKPMDNAGHWFSLKTKDVPRSR